MEVAKQEQEKQSFARYKANNTIEEGDLVVMYLSKETMSIIRVKDGDYFNCKFGSYKHSDMLGLQFGTKLGSNTGRGFLYLLHPTPELWTLVLPHRTQILYIADISFVMNFLNLKPGMSMIESGTGSGSFSHSIARTLAPTGHLYTFEYHQERVNAAKKEFEDHGLSDMVTLECRDVCKNGFGMENKVDAIFLDLPAPWDAVASAKKAFKQDKIGKICTFSPCIEQISRTVTALNDEGFVDIQMYECLIRFNEIRVIPMWTIEQAMEKQRATELKRKRATPRVVRENNNAAEGEENKKVKTEEDSNQSSGAGTPVTNPDSEMESAPASASATPSAASTPILPAEETTAAATTTAAAAAPRERIDPLNVVVTKLPEEQRGHTSYLMFATFTPATQHPNLTQKNAEAAAAAAAAAKKE